MKNNIFICGSRSTALIVSKVLNNYRNELNLNFLNAKKSKKNKLRIKYIFDPLSKKISFKTDAIFSNKSKDLKKFISN